MKLRTTSIFLLILIILLILMATCTPSTSNSQTPPPENDGWILIGEKGSCKLYYKHDSNKMNNYYWSVCYSSSSGDVATSLVVR
jgi:hypothetical protein